MWRNMVWTAVASITLAGVVAQPATAADPLNLVPSNALALVVVNGLDSLDAKVGEAGKSLQFPVPGPLTALKAVPGLKDCLDTEAAIVFAVLPGEKEPVPVAVVPVSDFEAFAKLFGGEADGDVIELQMPRRKMAAVEKDGCAVLVAADQADLLKTVLASEESITEQLGENLAWIADRDIAAIATDAGIAELCDKALEGIDIAQVAMEASGQDEFGAAQVLDVYKKMFAGIDQEVELLAVGADLLESGDLVVRVRKQFVEGGRLAACLEADGSAPDFLAGLPPAPFVMAGGAKFNETFGDLMMEFSIDAMKAAPKLYGIGEEQADRMLELAGPMMADMESIGMMFAVGDADDSLYSRMILVMRTGDAAAYMKAYQDYIVSFSELMKGSEGVFSMDMRTRPIEVDGCQGIEISMAFPEKWFSDLPEAQKMLEKMLGPGGKIKAFIVAADEKHVLIGYTKQTLLKQAIAAIKKGESVAQDAAIQAVAAKLDDGNYGQGYFNPAGMIEFVNAMITTMARGNQKNFQLPPFPETPPLAWSANADGATVDAQVIVPGELLKAIAVYTAQVRQAVRSPSE